MNAQGDVIAAMLRTARSDVLIVAPFIRSAALARLLDAIPEGVATSIVTRWRPLDIIAGASDLEVFDIAESAGIAVFLRHDLHAKLYAADDRCLVGSANVTYTALGWREPSNLELLTSLPRTTAEIVEIEEQLRLMAVRATPEHRDQVASLVDRMREQIHQMPDPETATQEVTPGLVPPTWMPRSKNPEDLYAVYAGDHDAVGRTGLAAILEEIEALGVPPGLSESDFVAWVSVVIGQTPVVATALRAIDEAGGMTEDAYRELLEQADIDLGSFTTREALLVLQRWLSLFMPDSFSTTPTSIKLIKSKKL